MTNAYTSHIAIETAQEASIFSNETTWNILEFLRKKGTKGMTEPEIVQEFKKQKITVPSTSQIYSVLKKLYEMEWVHRDWDNKEGARRHVIAYHWWGVKIDDDFYEIISKKMELKFKEKLFPVLLECCKDSLNELKNDKKNKQWLPSPSEICKKCEQSHEAQEFFDTILEVALIKFEESEEFVNLLKENNYLIQE